MADLTRRRFFASTGIGAGLALAGGLVRFPRGGGEVRATLPLEEVQVNCGFKVRSGSDPAELAYGRAIREKLYQETLTGIGHFRSQGHAAQLDAAADVLENIAAHVDRGCVRELWLHVIGNVDGKYRGREYVVEL